MKPFIPKIRSIIIYDYNCRQSSHTIAKWLGCEKLTINDILKHFHEIHSLTPKK